MQVVFPATTPRGVAGRHAHDVVAAFLMPGARADGSSRSVRDDPESPRDEDAPAAVAAHAPADIAALFATEHGALAVQARHNERLASQAVASGDALRSQQRSAARQPAPFRAALAEAADRGKSATPVKSDAAKPASEASVADSNSKSQATASPGPNEPTAPTSGGALKTDRGGSGGAAAQPEAHASKAQPASPVALPPRGAPDASAVLPSASPAIAGVAPPQVGAAIAVSPAAAPTGSAPGPRVTAAEAPAVARAETTSPPAASGSRSGPPSTSAAVERAASSLPAADAGDFDANVERILRFVRTRIDGENSTTLMRLDPAELGTVRLRLELQQGVARLEIDTTTSLAHRLLGEQLESLRRGLEASGVRLEHVEVRAPAATNDAVDRSTTQDGPTDPQADGRRPNDAADASAGDGRESGTDTHAARPKARGRSDASAESPTGAQPVVLSFSTTGLNIWA